MLAADRKALQSGMRSVAAPRNKHDRSSSQFTRRDCGSSSDFCAHLSRHRNGACAGPLRNLRFCSWARRADPPFQTFKSQIALFQRQDGPCRSPTIQSAWIGIAFGSWLNRPPAKPTVPRPPRLPAALQCPVGRSTPTSALREHGLAGDAPRTAGPGSTVPRFQASEVL